MLAMYSSVLKKEKFMKRFAEDSAEASSVANDLTCELKILSVNSSEGRLDSCLEQVKNAEDNLKILNALLDNLKRNLDGYVGSLIQKDKVEEIPQERDIEQTVEKPTTSEEKQMSDIMNMVRTLKELKDSLPNEIKKV
jgi:hypothetical protein